MVQVFRNWSQQCNSHKCEERRDVTTQKEPPKKKVPQRIESCPYCETTFVDKASVRTHIRRQHRDWNFSCVRCCQCFKHRKALKLHNTRKHSGQSSCTTEHDDLFRCPFCNKKYKIKISLQAHIRYKHADRGMISCAFCPAKFSSEMRKRTHVKCAHKSQISFLIE